MKIAVFLDLNSINISVDMYKKAIEKIDGKVVYEKFYGYVASKNKDFSQYIKENQVEICLPLASRKKKKIDIRQCIDVPLYVATKDVDGVFIICSSVDALYMLKAVKSLNKRIYLGVLSQNELCEYCDEVIILDRQINIEFLPYSNVNSSKNELKDIKEKLDKIIDEKIKNSSFELENSDEIEKLLKKYF